MITRWQVKALESHLEYLVMGAPLGAGRDGSIRQRAGFEDARSELKRNGASCKSTRDIRQASAQRFGGGAETVGLELIQLLLSAPDETCQVNFRQSRLVGLELLQSPPERELASDA